MSESKLKKTSELADQIIEKLSKNVPATGYQQSNRKSISGLPGWSQDPLTGALHHSTLGVISTMRGPNGFTVQHGGKNVGNFADVGGAGAGIKNYITNLAPGETGSHPPQAMNMTKAEADKKSKVVSTTKLIKPSDVDDGPGVDSISVKEPAGAKMSVSSKHKLHLPAQQKMALKKGWGQHLPFPTGEPNLPKQPVLAGDEVAAQQLANMMHSKAMLRPDHQQPSEQDMLMAGEKMGLGESQAMIKSQDDKWGNTINNWLSEATKPITNRFASEEEEAAYWASIKVSDRDDGGTY